MKKFSFTLNRLLGYRQRLLDEEKNKLGQLRAVQLQIEESIRRLEQEFQELSRELMDEQLAGLPSYRLKSYDIKLMGARSRQEALKIALKKAEDDVERQLDVLALASMEVSKLEKLEERQREEYNVGVRKAEEMVLDEFIASDVIRKMAQ